MQILIWVIFIAAVYFVLIFLVLRLAAPFMGFVQYQAPTDIPDEVRQSITLMENKATDQMSYLMLVYSFVMGRWEHSRLKAAVMLPKLFKRDLLKIWRTKGFMYCATINFLVNVLLANSKFFAPEDVKVRHVFLNFVPHQYLQVKVGEKWVDVDPAGAGIRGLGLGHHLSWFG